MATSGGHNTEKPARNAVAIDVSSTDHEMGVESRGIFVGGGGILEVNMVETGAAIQFTCLAGTLLPIQTSKVLNANTTASLIVALY